MKAMTSIPVHNEKSILTRKPVFGICDQVRYKTLDSISVMGADWRFGKRRGLRPKGSLVRDLVGSPLAVALSK